MKILIVDDEPLVRKSLARACMARGHTVSEAADGLEGLEKWRADPPDVAFIDVLMPGLSGPDLLREVGARGGAKAILISAFSGDHDLRAAPGRSQAPGMAAGADLFIPKPFDDIFAIVAKAEALHGGTGKVD
jgi:CheY-like chemotaxis protein